MEYEIEIRQIIETLQNKKSSIELKYESAEKQKKQIQKNNLYLQCYEQQIQNCNDDFLVQQICKIQYISLYREYLLKIREYSTTVSSSQQQENHIYKQQEIICNIPLSPSSYTYICRCIGYIWWLKIYSNINWTNTNTKINSTKYIDSNVIANWDKIPMLENYIWLNNTIINYNSTNKVIKNIWCDIQCEIVNIFQDIGIHDGQNISTHIRETIKIQYELIIYRNIVNFCIDNIINDRYIYDFYQYKLLELLQSYNCNGKSLNKLLKITNINERINYLNIYTNILIEDKLRWEPDEILQNDILIDNKILLIINYEIFEKYYNNKNYIYTILYIQYRICQCIDNITIINTISDSIQYNILKRNNDDIIIINYILKCIYEIIIRGYNIKNLLNIIEYIVQYSIEYIKKNDSIYITNELFNIIVLYLEIICQKHTTLQDIIKIQYNLDISYDTIIDNTIQYRIIQIQQTDSIGQQQIKYHTDIYECIYIERLQGQCIRVLLEDNINTINEYFYTKQIEPINIKSMIQCNVICDIVDDEPISMGLKNFNLIERWFIWSISIMYNNLNENWYWYLQYCFTCYNKYLSCDKQFIKYLNYLINIIDTINSNNNMFLYSLHFWIKNESQKQIQQYNYDVYQNMILKNSVKINKNIILYKYTIQYLQCLSINKSCNNQPIQIITKLKNSIKYTTNIPKNFQQYYIYNRQCYWFIDTTIENNSTINNIIQQNIFLEILLQENQQIFMWEYILYYIQKRQQYILNSTVEYTTLLWQYRCYIKQLKTSISENIYRQWIICINILYIFIEIIHTLCSNNDATLLYIQILPYGLNLNSVISERRLKYYNIDDDILETLTLQELCEDIQNILYIELYKGYSMRWDDSNSNNDKYNYQNDIMGINNWQEEIQIQYIEISKILKIQLPNISNIYDIYKIFILRYINWRRVYYKYDTQEIIKQQRLFIDIQFSQSQYNIMQDILLQGIDKYISSNEEWNEQEYELLRQLQQHTIMILHNKNKKIVLLSPDDDTYIKLLYKDEKNFIQIRDEQITQIYTTANDKIAPMIELKSEKNIGTTVWQQKNQQKKYGQMIHSNSTNMSLLQRLWIQIGINIWALSIEIQNTFTNYATYILELEKHIYESQNCGIVCDTVYHAIIFKKQTYGILYLLNHGINIKDEIYWNTDILITFHGTLNSVFSTFDVGLIV